jgi:creatinine amidohydrolase
VTFKPWLWQNTTLAVKEYLQHSTTILLPVGSTEQHGPALPLGTDALAAIHIAEDAGVRESILVAPPIWYGFAPQHMGGHGTVSVRGETLIALVDDVLMSLVAHGFSKIVIINGHRQANIPPLQIASANARVRTGAYVGILDPLFIALSTYREAVADGLAGIAHADGTEVAHMLHLENDLVDIDRIPGPDGAAPEHAGLPFGVTDPLSLDDRAIHVALPDEVSSQPHYLGSPDWGTAERGKTLHEGILARVQDYLRQVQALPEPMLHTPR